MAKHISNFMLWIMVKKMTSDTIELEGVDDFLNSLKMVSTESGIQLDQLLITSATDTQKKSISGIQRGPATGRTYNKTRPKRTHRASAPGQYPQTDLGTLVKNITFKKDGNLNYSVGSRKGAPHGYFLEMKSPAKGGRPWLSRSFEEMKASLNAQIKRIIK